MVVTQAKLANELGVSTRQVREYFSRGMPRDMDDSDIVGKCKRWKANNIDSHRGGWGVRGARHEPDEAKSSLIEIRIKKLEAEAELLRITNEQEWLNFFVRDALVNAICERFSSLFETLDHLSVLLYEKYVELEGRENEAARECIDRNMNFAKRQLLTSELLGVPFEEMLEEYERGKQDERKTDDD